MIASVPRSGSTYFCLRLWERSVFGFPLEYLNPQVIDSLARRLGAVSLVDYWHKIQTVRRTRNGWFGYKVFIKHLLHVASQESEILKSILPEAILYYTRADRVAQAVSYARAIQTAEWTSECRSLGRPLYNYELILAQERSIAYQEESWEKIFASMGIDPIRIEYSYFLDHEEQEVARIAQHLGVSLEQDPKVDIGVMKSQSDEMSGEWCRRYLEDKHRMATV